MRKCFISCGEYSGDLIAGDLVHALRSIDPTWTFFGVVGKSLESAGVEAVIRIEELSVMGFIEVLNKAFELNLCEKKILAAVDEKKPDIAILVDFPGFHFRLAEQLKIRGIAVIQYIAPKLWAWGEERKEKLKAYFDLVLGILPFEVEYFKNLGIPYIYVGSPLKDRLQKINVTREDFSFPEERPLVAMLLGSRLDEVQQLLPTMLLVKKLIKQKLPDAQFLFPIARSLLEKETNSLDDFLQTLMPEKKWYQEEDFVFSLGMSLEMMSLADVALVASGTATLECALLGTPEVVIYRMHPLSYELAKHKIKIRWVSLVNIILGEEVVKEFIQEFSLENVATEMVSLVKDKGKRTAMEKKFQDLRKNLEGQAAIKAAHEIKKFTESVHKFE